MFKFNLSVETENKVFAFTFYASLVTIFGALWALVWWLF